MHYIKGLDSYSSRLRSAVTLGKFDGLHRGHQELVERVGRYAREHGVRSVVCAFDMRPLFERLRIPGKVLMTREERRSMLEGRVDCLVDCPFTEEFSEMEAEDFIRDVLAGTFRAAYVVVGTDFRFGYEKKGDIHMLAACQEKYGYRLEVVEKRRYQGREISSTYIREALAAGDMGLVEELLGYPYSVQGIVEQGRKLGRTLGFPTCNVAPPKEKFLPPNGVYLEQIRLEGRAYAAVGNIGVKPTVSEAGRTLIESFLLGYEGDAYGKEMQICLKKFQRPERKFADVGEMKAQVDRDIEEGRAFFEI